MHAFHEIATPQGVLELLDENADQATKLEIALDALCSYPEAMATPELENAIETLRGK